MIRKLATMAAFAAAVGVLGAVPSPLRAAEGSKPPQQGPEGANEDTTTLGSALGGGKGVSFTSSSGNYSLQLGFWGQMRFQAYDRDAWRRTDRTDLTPPMPVENAGLTQYTFDFPLARLYARGKTFRPWLTYKIEFNLAANDQGLREVFIPPVDPVVGSNAVLIRSGTEDQDGRTLKMVDFYLDGSPRQAIGFRVGQFEIPQGRQEILTDDVLQMTSRSVASLYFNPGRDRGLQAYGETPSSRIAYRVGVFNGTGLERRANTDATLAYAMRLTATSKGPYAYIESNLDAPEGFHAQGGVSWYTNSMRTTATGDPLSLLGYISDRRVSADLDFFWNRRANLIIEYYQSDIRLDDSISPRMEFICFGAFEQGLLTCKQKGYYVQAGMLFGERNEIAVRYSMVDPDRELDRDRQIEATANYTYFFRRHALKWLTSLTFLKLEVNAPGSSGLAVQQGDSSIPIVPDFPNPGAFPGLTDDHNRALITQLQWIF